MPLSQNIDWNSGVLRLLSLTLQVTTLNLKGIKESEIEADVETIFSIASKYKLNWDNEHFVASNHKMVLDIQRTARKNMLSYEKKVSDIVRGKKLIVAHAQVKSALQDLLKKFKYYRLSLYTFSMASLMEVMLGGNFNEEYVSGIKDEIRQMSEAYRDLFGRCSVYLENLSSSSMEKNLLAGIGTAGKAVGTLIGNIPGIKEGPVDEFLVDQGSHMKKSLIVCRFSPSKSLLKSAIPKRASLLTGWTMSCGFLITQIKFVLTVKIST